MKTTTAAMISMLTCLALATGCASPAEPDDVDGSSAAMASPDPDAGMMAAGELLSAEPTDTTSVASTTKGVAAWRYDMSAHGFVLTAVSSDQTDGLRIAYAINKTPSGKSFLTGVVLSTPTHLGVVKALAENAKRDLDAALANVGELTDPTEGTDMSTSPETVFDMCEGTYASVLSLSAGGALFLDTAAVVMIATGVGAAVVVGVVIGVGILTTALAATTATACSR